ncbi:BCCT family transporter [uncultured Thiohalocapsa sp.]|uniref:BCCT family transporter n=1 Tax=uncultured Thiohalocapsa sp. TaxID=768990 RepID=UPI0025FB6B24|nr:BCCT family transporter [uncultured Thiohalocapsa sp.]
MSEPFNQTPASAGRRHATQAALAIIALLALAVLGWPDTATAVLSGITGAIVDTAGWLVLLFATALLLLGCAIAASPLGHLRLGGRDERPEFGMPSWLAMLFAAGMGSGLVFWGVAEPLTHSRTLATAGADSAAAAMAITWFHWGLHAWAIYALAALSIAWFHTRRGLPETPSAGIAAGWRGWLPAPLCDALGRAADLVGVAAVVFGVAGALANSIILLRVGIAAATGWTPPGMVLQLALLTLLAAAFMTSAVTGISHGIRWLSNLNLVAALVLLLALLVLGAPAAASALGLEALGTWLAAMPRWSLAPISMDGADGLPREGWAGDWTLTYLVWWIAWTPFVGLFIARISRGRTLRTFLLGVMLVPTLFSMLWFTVLGGGALAYDAAQDGRLTAALSDHYTRPLFLWLDALPLGPALALLVCGLLFVFMITSADSACFVLGMLSTGRADPGTPSKLGWGLLLTALTAGLLLRNDVDVNKAVAIIGALPFTVFLLLQVIALLRALRTELRRAA